MEKLESIEPSSGTKNNEKEEAPPAYEDILRETGEFGLYQILVSLIVGFAFAYGSFVTLNFIFGADIVEHRCWIPQCEPINSNDFNADWLERAVPFENGHPEPCIRYEFIGSDDQSCSEHNFNRSQRVACDGFIVKNNEQRLISHLNMMCTGQNHKLALLGTASMTGRTMAMPIFGVLSDKYGRLITITVSATLGAIFSVLQALPSNLMSFELYLAFEFLASLLSTGIMAAGFVYIMEWTTAKYRVRIVNLTVFMELMIPYTFLSLTAWYFADNFIAYRLALGLPGFLMVAFYFILGESPQWLLSQNKCDQTIKSISKAAHINRKSLDAFTIRRIENLSALSANELADDKEAIKVSIVDLLRQKTLAFRLFITSVIWMCLYFSYYGVFFRSAKVHDNKYLSVAIIGLADIPGNFLNDQLLNRIGRRMTIFVTVPVFSAMLFASTQLPAGQETIQLIFFAIGKTAIVAACIGYYTFSTEFWPTSVRGTAANIGTTAARLGSMLASLAVLLDDYYANLPVFLNAAAGIIGTVLVFAFLPETMHCEKLPDTMEEALAIGRSTRRKSENNIT